MTLLPAVLAGCALLVWALPTVARLRLGALRPSIRRSAPAARQAAAPVLSKVSAGKATPAAERRAGSRRSRWPAALLAGCASGALVGGVAGLVVGFVTAFVTDRALARLQPRAIGSRRAQLVADLPLAIDLLAACLRAGRPPTLAVEAVAASLPGPLGAELAQVAAACRLGSDPQAAWARMLADDQLAPFGRGMVRVWDSGAPVADVLDRMAADARRARRASAEQRARAVGVKAAAPLGLCFLPAFVLVGIVPLVAGAVGGLLR